MDRRDVEFERRQIMAGMAALVFGAGLATPALGRSRRRGLGLSSILGKASDSALDKLALPGAFYDDPDIRIGLPIIGGIGGGGDSGGGGLGGLLSNAIGGGGIAGLALGGLTRKLNDAAGVAAGEAKPIFRHAIDDLSFSDVPGIVRQNDGGSRYLRDSAGDELHGKLRPMVDSALGDLGAFNELDDLTARHSYLAAAGISRDGLGRTVTDQGLNGIFKYIGKEEADLRANPIGKAGGLFKGIFGN